MPLRDEDGRFCGTLSRKEVDGHWERNFFILDEDECLLRYFSYMVAQEEKPNWDEYDGEINIRLITKIEDKSKSDDKSMPEGSFEIQTCNERFYVRADTKEGSEEWIRTLRKVAVDPSKRQEPREDVKSPPTQNGEESADSSGKTERVCYETKIIAGVVVRTPVRKLTDSDSEAGSLAGDTLMRSGSAGMTSIIKPIKEGYLVKKGAVIRNWKRRYFRLDNFKLAYYEKESDKDPIKIIPSADIIKAGESLGADNDREHVFEVATRSRTFFIQGSTAEEMHSWIDAIAGVSVRGRSTSEPEGKKVEELKNVGYYQYAQTTAL